MADPNNIGYNGPTRVNNYKIVEMRIGDINGKVLASNVKSQWFGSFKDWKTYSGNSKTYTAVDNSILLMPNKLQMQGGYTYELGTLNDILSDGILGKVKDAAVNFSQAKAIAGAARADFSEETVDSMVSEFATRYGNMPYFKSVMSSGLSTLELSFNYGQDYLFDANEEVVKPIKRLAAIFAPINDESGGNSFANKIKAPAEGRTRAMAGILSAIFTGNTNAQEVLNATQQSSSSSGSGAGRSELSQSGSSSSNDNPEGAKGLTAAMFAAVDAAAQSLTTRAFMLRVGKMYLGPYFPEGCNWEFDYTHTDANGYPLSGTITFSGLKLLVTELAEDIESSII